MRAEPDRLGVEKERGTEMMDERQLDCSDESRQVTPTASRDTTVTEDRLEGQGFQLPEVQVQGELSLDCLEMIDPTWGGVDEPDLMQD